MQDIQTIFGDGDRRMRPTHNHPSDKCPRCDSLNTKFCYYNNYNLSQPRHFCKGCKRYWTKGGVLRNVPVGGGCRKNKRSKPNPSSDSNFRSKSKSNSRSSSESSSQTAAAATTISAALPESSSASPTTLISFQNPKLFLSQPVNSIHDPVPVDCSLDCGIFPDIGSFTNLMTSLNDSSLLGFNLADIPPYRFNHENRELNRQCDENQVVDPTVEMDLSNVGLSTVDWQAEEGLFDLTSGQVDQSFWSHTNWSGDDHNDKPHNQLP